jgi:glycosyltransferase involved in cell wall biosynthesis
MRICVIDTVDTPYRADSTDTVSMGGTQAAACYLTQALAALGHKVAFWTNTDQPGMAKGVECANLYRLSSDMDRNFDVVVLMSAVNQMIVRQFRAFFPPTTRFALWIQHAHDQQGPSALADPEVAGLWDAFALVSGWQARCYIDAFKIDPHRIHIMRNAASPGFSALFAPDEDVSAAKLGGPTEPVRLAYSSAPYRGLALVAGMFPLIRARIPEARLQVFSGPPAGRTDAQRADPLFNTFLNMDGVEHVGSLPQAELARKMKSTAIHLYPNTFAETSCVSVIEAMAAGCRVVTSNLGALPETTACFGVLKEPFLGGDVNAYIKAFVDETCAQIDFLRRNPAAGAVLRQQVDYSRYNNWALRAREWEALLERLCAGN